MLGAWWSAPLQLVVVLPSLAQLAIILALQRHEACTLGVVPRPHCRPPGTFVEAWSLGASLGLKPAWAKVARWDAEVLEARPPKWAKAKAS